jgi:hypothetical protein
LETKRSRLDELRAALGSSTPSKAAREQEAEIEQRILIMRKRTVRAGSLLRVDRRRPGWAAESWATEIQRVVADGSQIDYRQRGIGPKIGIAGRTAMPALNCRAEKRADASSGRCVNDPNSNSS